MAGEPVGHFESVLAHQGKQPVGIGQSHEAVADVSHRRHAESLPQCAGRAAVIGDGDDRSDVDRFFPVLVEFSQSTQQDRQTSATANADNSHRPSPAKTTLMVLHRMLRSRPRDICFA